MKIISIIKTAVLTLILFVISSSLNAQWNVPNDAKNIKIPSAPSYETVNKGKELYYITQGISCKSCHGDPGKGNFNAAIKAPDLGIKSFSEKNTPGEIFYKIKTGMGAMPSFANIYNEDQIWNIVSFIKSFDEEFKISGEKITTLNGKIVLKSDESSRKVLANISITDASGNNKSPEGVKIAFFVKRIFGDLPIGESVITNQIGTVAFQFPENIPGDADGKIIVKAAFKAKDLYGSKIDSLELNWGTPLHFKNEVLERTLWGPNNRVPIWLILTYLFVTIGVWIGIIYVIIGIIRIKKA